MPPSASVLFHPKKRTYAATQAKPKTPVGTPPSSSTPPASTQSQSQDPTQSPATNGNGATTPKPNGSTPSTPNKKPRLGPRRPPPRAATDDDPTPSEPEGPFSEFRLVSSALNGWKYDVMKFDSRKAVDIMSWAQPVKLNRKDPFRRDGSEVVQQAPQAVGPMLGPDGKPVIGVDGRMVMVDANGRPIRAADANGNSSNGTSAGGGGANGKDKDKEKASKKKFQKKTKQVFLVPDEVRQLRREERYPWILEDGQQHETWVGKMEEVARSDTHAMFMPAANDVFKFVPAHRWYKFQKKPAHHVLSLEEAETLMSQRNKNKDPERWLIRNRAQAASGSASVKTEGGMLSASQGASLVHSASQSLGPGGRRLRTVDNGGGGGLFGDDDDEDGGGRGRNRSRELGAEGDLDELDFEEDFADDEEKVEADGEDEEAKEAEERLKKEYKTANKTREGYIDESDEEEDDKTKLSSSHKSMQKLIKKLDNQLQGDDDDDDADPYASGEEESSDEEEPQVQTGPAIQPHEPKANSRAGSLAPSGSKTPTTSQAPVKTESTSRATSPAPAAAGHGGHSIVAMRATSPKAPKLKTNGTSRAGSPLTGGSGSRATSPVTAGASGDGRAESPPAATGGDGAKASNKRKAMDEPTSPTGATSVGGAPSKPKKRKATAGGEITQQMLVEWLTNTPKATTKDCIQYFSSYLPKEDKSKKQAFADLVKEVAILKDGVLVLRNAYKQAAGGAGAASPAPA